MIFKGEWITNTSQSKREIWVNAGFIVWNPKESFPKMRRDNAKIQISLYEDDKLVYTSEKGYTLWSEVTGVRVNGKLFNYNSKLSSSREIVFTHFSDSNVINIDSLHQLNEVGNV